MFIAIVLGATVMTALVVGCLVLGLYIRHRLSQASRPVPARADGDERADRWRYSRDAADPVANTYRLHTDADQRGDLLAHPIRSAHEGD